MMLSSPFLFSHIPNRTFEAWIRALFDTVSEDGLLVFTTHGRISHEDLNHPPLEPEGYWFTPYSEQKDIPTDEYGGMIVTPRFVIESVSQCPCAALVRYQEGFWWGKQDLFVIRRVATDFRPPTSPSGLDPHTSTCSREQRSNEAVVTMHMPVQTAKAGLFHRLFRRLAMFSHAPATRWDNLNALGDPVSALVEPFAARAFATHLRHGHSRARHVPSMATKEAADEQ